MYQYDRFLRQIEFSYVPKIKSNYSPYIGWPKNSERRNHKEYRFFRQDNWELEFHDCIVKNDEDKYVVECPTNVGVITGILKSTGEEEGFSCRFEIPVNPYEINIIDSQGMIQEETTDRQLKLGLTDLAEAQYWIGFKCFGEYKDCLYKLKLRTSNGIEQEEYLPISKNGCGNFNLMAFYDSLNTCPLPAQIELWCEDDEDKVVPIVIVSDVSEMAQRPVYINSGFIVLGLKDENKDLTIKRFGTDPFEMKLPYNSSILGKSKVTRGYPCTEKLEEGLYVVEGERQTFDFIFEDDTGVELSNGKNTMYVSSREKRAPIVSFTDWLDQLVKDIVDAGVNKDLDGTESFERLSAIRELEIGELKKYDYERLAALPYFVESKCVETKKETIRKCMNEISRCVLDGHMRLELIRLLTELKCSQSIFDICLQEYNLLLFERGSDDSKMLAEKLENNSTELSMLLLMGIEESVWNTIRRDKYRDMIGKEAIRCMLSVPDEDDPGSIANEQKKFLREYSPCKVRINLTKEISGDMEPLSAMLEVTRKSVVFNISKKPDYGIYFDRIRYVDQYVNWYTVSHDKKGEMIPWKRDLMKSVVQSECSSIVKSIRDLGKDEKLGMMVKRYESVLRERFKGDPLANMNINSYPRYFYLQGLAAFLVMLPSEYSECDSAVKCGERFMCEASKIAPWISKRDLVMAATYIYLVRKEERICQ